MLFGKCYLGLLWYALRLCAWKSLPESRLNKVQTLFKNKHFFQRFQLKPLVPHSSICANFTLNLNFLFTPNCHKELKLLQHLQLLSNIFFSNTIVAKSFCSKTTLGVRSNEAI